MTHTRGYARNKEQDMLEGAEQSVGHETRRIASATGRFCALSQISGAHRNTVERDISLFQRYSRTMSDQFLSS